MRLRKFSSFRTLISALQDLKLGSPYKVLCFDVFDTLIFRRCHPDLVTEGVCRWVKTECQRMGSPAPDNILELRGRAYQKLIGQKVAQCLDMDCSLTELCNEWAAEILPHDPEQARALAVRMEQREAEMEKAVCFANVPMRELLRYLKFKGFRIIFASDMYLGGHVQEILEACGFDGIFDQGYVSGDHALLKRTGKLFTYILEKEAIPAGNILHIGDNPLGDGQRPTEKKIDACLVRDKTETRRTNALEFDFIYGKRDPLYAGFAAAAFACYPPNETGSYEEAIGARLFGPIFATFMHGVAARCAEDKLENVYFPAREGSLLKELFLELAPLVYTTTPIPNAIYIGLSRYTTMLYGMKEFGLRELTRILINIHHISIRNVLSPLQMPDELLEKAALAYGISNIDLELPAAYMQWGSFQRILHHPAVRNHIESASTSTKKLMNDYLEQRGFFACSRVGIVDIGWNAQIQENLDFGMLNAAKRPRISGMYMATRLTAHWTKTPQNRVECILADEMQDDWHSKAAFEFPIALELAARAPHGTVIGYERSPDGNVVPIFKSSATGSRQQEQNDDLTIAQLQTGIRAYAKSYRLACELFGFEPQQMRPFAGLMIDRLIRFPTRNEALIFLRTRNVSDLGSDAVIAFDNEIKLGFWHILTNLRKIMRQAHWRNGVLAAMLLGFMRPLYMVFLAYRKAIHLASHRSWSDSSTLACSTAAKDDDPVGRKQTPLIEPQPYEAALKKEEQRLAALGRSKARNVSLNKYTAPLSLGEAFWIYGTAWTVGKAIKMAGGPSPAITPLSFKLLLYRALYCRSPSLTRKIMRIKLP